MDRIMISKIGIAAVLALAGGLIHSSLPAAINFQEPNKAPTGGEQDKPGWKSLFDGKTLDGWKAADFNHRGKVFVKDGTVILEKGNLMTGMTYTRRDFPTMDYEVSLEGKKIEGDDFFCTTTFPVGQSFCSFVVGGWGGATVGLSSIDSMDASENETSTSKEFKKGQWYRVRIRVTKDRIRAWLDDEQMVDLETTGRRISIRLECGPCKPFGIATWDTSGAIRNIRVRALTETEKKAASGK
jgi:hypothetical protein